TPPRVARRPRATARAEHVVAHDGGPDAVVAVPDEEAVDALPGARAGVVRALQLGESTGVEYPLVQAHPADPDRVLLALVRASAVAVQGDGEVVYAYLCHDASLAL